jgi:hypothetical protein
MKLLKRKNRKAIRKSVNKVMKRHGPAIAAAIGGGIASTLAALASTEAPDGKGKSNLAKLSENVSEALTPDKKKSRTRAALPSAVGERADRGTRRKG